VRAAGGRVGIGLVGIAVSAVLVTVLPGTPAAADPTPTSGPSPTASGGAPSATTPAPSGSKAAARRKAAAERKKAADAAAKVAAQQREEAGRQAAEQKAAAEKKAAEQRRAEAEAAHDTAALIAATQALVEAEAKLSDARKTLASAQQELAAAKAADVAAQQELNAAAFAEQRATRELAAVEARILAHQVDLGRLARAAYQSNGPLGEWSLMLSSESPNTLADRLATLQSVASAGNAVLADLRQDRADLINAQASLTAAREEQQAAADAARQALEDKAAHEREASQAEQYVGVEVDARATALAAAQRAAAEDKAQYHEMVMQSGALATRIRVLAAKLAKGKHAPHGTGRFDLPGRGVVTSTYGPRMHPILHYVKIHTGIDFAAADGVAYAADDGVVLITEYNVAYGNMTVIDHGTIGGRHITTMYAHQAAFGVRPGDRVRKGQPIGVIGSTGYATGPHLHFEVRVDGSPIDPAPFLVDSPLPPAPRDAVRRAGRVT
jgi:murein DD-endopeptidase MepM/ murein hydrolase activator NlpD